MKYERYLIKKEKLDLLSSLKLLDKKIVNEKLKEYGLKNINELKDCWQEYENDILEHIYSIWIDGDIEETNLNEIFTPEFWEGFYKYVKEHE